MYINTIHKSWVCCLLHLYKINVVQLLSCGWLFITPWTTACQVSLSFTISQSLLKLVHWVGDAIQPSYPLPSPSPPALNLFQHEMFSNESVLCIRWLKYWNSSFIISPSNEYSGLISFRIDWFDLLQSKGLSRVFSSTTVQKHQFFHAQSSLRSNSHICTLLLEEP